MEWTTNIMILQWNEKKMFVNKEEKKHVLFTCVLSKIVKFHTSKRNGNADTVSKCDNKNAFYGNEIKNIKNKRMIYSF